MRQDDVDLEGLLVRIRNGGFVSPAVCRSVFTQDTADAFRQLVTDSDLESALSLLDRAGHDDVFRLGLHMLQALQLRSNNEAVRYRVRGILEGLWLAGCNTAARGTSLCFALLNEASLTEVWLERLFKFYVATWDYQLENQRTWAGGADRVAEKVRQRLRDPRFPSSKRWIYVLALAASDSPREVDSILATIDGSGDPLVQHAIKEVHVRMSL